MLTNLLTAARELKGKSWALLANNGFAILSQYMTADTPIDIVFNNSTMSGTNNALGAVCKKDVDSVTNIFVIIFTVFALMATLASKYLNEQHIKRKQELIIVGNGKLGQKKIILKKYFEDLNIDLDNDLTAVSGSAFMEQYNKSANDLVPEIDQLSSLRHLYKSAVLASLLTGVGVGLGWWPIAPMVVVINSLALDLYIYHYVKNPYKVLNKHLNNLPDLALNALVPIIKARLDNYSQEVAQKNEQLNEVIERKQELSQALVNQEIKLTEQKEQLFQTGSEVQRLNKTLSEITKERDELLLQLKQQTEEMSILKHQSDQQKDEINSLKSTISLQHTVLFKSKEEMRKAEPNLRRSFSALL